MPRHAPSSRAGWPLRHSPLRARLTRSLALAAAVPLALGACSSAVSQEAGGGHPVDGGTLTVGTVMDIQPSIFYGMVFQSFNGNVLEALVDYPAEGLEPQPRLATAWEVSEDGTSVRLELRDGVTFHSGREFGNTDVEYSIKATADPVNAAPIARSAGVITEFDTSEPGVITLGLTHPISNLFDVLAAVPIVDSETDAGLKDASEIIGTGPFLFDSWTPGSEYQFSRNENYWGDAARLDEVVFKVVPDPQALASQLRAGQLDVVSGVTNRDARQLDGDSRYVVESLEGSGGGTYLGLNVTDGALQDVQVRRAIAHAIDQDRISEEVYLGFGRGGDLPWTSDSPIFDEVLDNYYPYDLAAAEKLLDEAGATNLRLPLSYAAESPAYATIAQIIQADLAQIGVEVTLAPRPMAEMTQLGAVPGGIEGLWLNGHQWTNFSPSTIPVSAYAFNSEKNISNFTDEAYQAAARAAWATTPDAAASGETYRELAETFLDSAFVHEVFVSNGTRIRSSGVEGVTSGKTVALGLADAHLTR